MASPSGTAADPHVATAAAVGDEGAANLISGLTIGEKNVLPAGGAAEGGVIGHDTATRPTVLVLIGMAGAGKTTLTNRLIGTLRAEGRAPYVINLDPACADPPYPVNIDIRDTVDYKKVMENYSLGPNGAIVTSLNLFSTKFDQVIQLLLQKRLKPSDFVIIDTPGQIEVFMWSASGQIILQSLASHFRSMVLYVTDLTNTINPITFIANMTYGLSIFYKCRLPMVIALNKCDRMVKSEEAEGGEVPATVFAEKWMTDFETYQKALEKYEGYAANLASSLCLSLDEFYSNFGHVSVSATTGQGMAALFEKITEAVTEYESVFLPEFKKEIEAGEKKKKGGQGESKRKEELKKLRRAMVRPAKKSRFGETAEDDEEASASIFSTPATAETAAGFSLSMGGADEEDTDTSDDEEGEEREESDDNEEDRESFKQFYERQMLKKGSGGTGN